VDETGLHGLSCRSSAGRQSRHAAVNDIIARSLRSAEIPSLREPPGCSHEDGKRPDGLTLIPWSRGRSLVWDFTCVDTFAASYVLDTANYSGAAAVKAEERKRRKYDFLLGRYHFVPVAVETSGVWGKEGLKFIRQIGQRISSLSGELKSTCFLLQRVSIAVQRGNVASILGTLPPGKELLEIFYL
jgi:hypothetical protein